MQRRVSTSVTQFFLQDQFMIGVQSPDATTLAMKVIEILWCGPFTENEVQRHDLDNHDYGLYAIYGTHAIFGPDSLLYVGQANSNPFGKRVPAHTKVWTKFEALAPTIFLGRIRGPKNGTLDDARWGKLIDDAERLIIFECAPPYNSKGLRDFSLDLRPSNAAPSPRSSTVEVPDPGLELGLSEVLVVNLGRRHRLPMYCSSYFSRLSDVDPDSYYRRNDDVVKS